MELVEEIVIWGRDNGRRLEVELVNRVWGGWENRGDGKEGGIDLMGERDELVDKG